ncbi:universal stress protein [Oceanisphaera avium]|uniref:Universal stress protein n=1 Tax=Oceanisphaera avium TaxID=1903694 RepID=A0A1Y0CVV8_9GAMM|nr:universal stress protein [Oceanisphaera avium]ART79432.1 universal stress global response regulator UspA [Oceanisphaera avium]
MPYHNILLALELNHYEKPLLKRALDLAEFHNAKLHIIHVAPELGSVYTGSLNLDLRQLKAKLRIENGAQIMQMLKDEAYNANSISLPGGDIQQAVRHTVQALNIDLLICGRQQSRPFFGHLFSNSSGFLDIDGCDILVIKLSDKASH